jgi:flavodoxin
MKTALMVYWSSTGNTEKVALAIKEGLEAAKIKVTLKKPAEAADLDYFDYDLVCIGSPSLQWHIAKYRQQGKIKPTAPKIPGKYAIIFCTYSGPHTGLDEATPAGKYMRQFFEHLGFTVLDEWYILSEFHGNLENSTKGRMGDIRGKPTEQELAKIRKDAEAVAAKLA